MSDGNFNRSLLPHTPFQSGLATGRMQMRKRAEDALRDILHRHFVDLTPQQFSDIMCEFQEGTRM